MEKHARIMLSLLSVLLILGQAADSHGAQSSALRQDAGKLAALVRGNSFREADKLAATLLADPALDAHTMAVCGLAVLKAGRVREAEVMDLYPLERPELLAAQIDRSAVAADVPLYLFDATTVEASMAGAPPAFYILDTAAATNLVDGPFFAEHIKPKLDPARIVSAGIQGAGGAQQVNQVNGLSISLGPLVFEGQTVYEFPMETLNEIGGRYLAGLLGNPLLWPYRVHMDFRAGRLILEKRPI